MKMLKIFVAGLFLIANLTFAQTRVYRCIEVGTGKVAFSDIPCSGKSSGAGVDVRPNTLDSSGSREQVQIRMKQRTHQKAQGYESVPSMPKRVHTETEPLTGIRQTVCPLGTQPLIDEWGNQICKKFDAGLQPIVGTLSCPVGSHPWVDQWGTQICKNYDTGKTLSVKGSLDNCPIGTHPWIDEWGNRVCQGNRGGDKYYDTSKGCPFGTFPWLDNWGNNVCKKF